MHAYVRVYVRECARGTTYSFGLNANHLVTNAEAGNVSRGVLQNSTMEYVHGSAQQEMAQTGHSCHRKHRCEVHKESRVEGRPIHVVDQTVR